MGFNRTLGETVCCEVLPLVSPRVEWRDSANHIQAVARFVLAFQCNVRALVDAPWIFLSFLRWRVSPSGRERSGVDLFCKWGLQLICPTVLLDLGSSSCPRYILRGLWHFLCLNFWSCFCAVYIFSWNPRCCRCIERRLGVWPCKWLISGGSFFLVGNLFLLCSCRFCHWWEWVEFADFCYVPGWCFSYF